MSEQPAKTRPDEVLDGVVVMLSSLCDSTALNLVSKK